MKNCLYNIIYSESNKTIRFNNDELGPIKRKDDEKLVAQIEGEEDAKHIVRLIEVLRPDLKIDESEIEGGY